MPHTPNPIPLSTGNQLGVPVLPPLAVITPISSLNGGTITSLCLMRLRLELMRWLMWVNSRHSA
ncbi:hypothetical protein JAAARDRAFT_476569 [Jaapia argillacea MUCL 33604]|uniref:Uncharacterized protein n=1 Tax=Jaapia argillacea MUCL 33604 TaxID=933084 RepID=A0A067PF72_9AGAM|nr:hypothetical protein JAAARDRAFT_476569 [Jaapia argillacea MUCL 33604]